MLDAVALEFLDHDFCQLDRALCITASSARLGGLKLDAADVAGLPLAQVLAARLVESQATEVQTAALAVLATGQARRLPVGQDCEIVLLPATDGLVMVVLDHGDRRRELSRFERILDSTPDGIFVIDADRRIRLFNQACSFITGRAADKILHEGCECSNVIHCHTPEGESLATHLCPARDVFSGERHHGCEEMMLTNARGEERWVETTYSAISDGRGGVEFVVGVLRDVHDRKVLEQKLNQVEKLASLGQLVAGIAHEIKNPLAIINSSLDVIANEARPAEQRREATTYIREEVRRIDLLLKSFLAFARPRHFAMRPTLLSGLIRRRIASMELLFPNIRFSIEVATPEPIVMADEEQLGQVLTNLVLNAGEAMDGRGDVALRAGHNDLTATLEVEDDGPGIARELHGRIFDPFFTTKSAGTGLGLSICYQVVAAHGGTISVTGRRDGRRGTCFALRLPTAARAANAGGQITNFVPDSAATSS